MLVKGAPREKETIFPDLIIFTPTSKSQYICLELADNYEIWPASLQQAAQAHDKSQSDKIIVPSLSASKLREI